jgi:L-rhamnose mutarotase
MQAKRFCLTLDLKNDPALIAAYEHYHQAEVIWPEILEGNKEIGILSMDIYRAGNRLFMIMETVADFDLARDFDRLKTLPRQKEWANLMLLYQQGVPFAKPGEHWVLMQLIFSQ